MNLEPVLQNLIFGLFVGSNYGVAAAGLSLVFGVLRVLKEIAATTDITILCVTHEMQFARDVSDRVMMFDQGQVLEEGVPEKLFTEPEHERTREFLRAVIERA